MHRQKAKAGLSLTPLSGIDFRGSQCAGSQFDLRQLADATDGLS